jgi:sugar lactone lactonase YvrE
VREVDTSGTIRTIAGTGAAGRAGDGSAATSATLFHPVAVAVDPAGNLYIADSDNSLVRRIDTSGTITTVAGSTISGFAGDGGPATSAEMFSVEGVAVDARGQLYITDSDNQRVRFVDTAGVITTIVGDSLAAGVSGDGGAATSGFLDLASGCAFDGAGNLFIVDLLNERIRRVDTTGVITTVAGDGGQGVLVDGVPATTTRSRSTPRAGC